MYIEKKLTSLTEKASLTETMFNHEAFNCHGASV